MRKFLFLSLALAAPAASAPQSPATFEVRLSSFDYSPREIRLRAGQPVILNLINVSGGGHDFASPSFFAASTIHRGGTARIDRGRVEVPARQSRTVHLTPARGQYRLRCTHTLHSTLGMRGRIIVE
jgi:plastocyanin